MNIKQVLDVLKSLPEETLLYNSGTIPTWIQGSHSTIALGMEPVPVQTVGKMIDNLQSVLNYDLPSQDIKFRRKAYEDLNLYITTVKNVNGNNIISTDLVTNATIELWKMYQNDHQMIDVALGHPSYILGNNKIKLLVNNPYFLALGPRGQREYINALINTISFRYINEDGEEIIYNKDYWYGKGSANCIRLKDRIGGFTWGI